MRGTVGDVMSGAEVRVMRRGGHGPKNAGSFWKLREASVLIS